MVVKKKFRKTEGASAKLAQNLVLYLYYMTTG
jgi:hypothetical protein